MKRTMQLLGIVLLMSGLAAFAVAGPARAAVPLEIQPHAPLPGVAVQNPDEAPPGWFAPREPGIPFGELDDVTWSQMPDAPLVNRYRVMGDAEPGPGGKFYVVGGMNGGRLADGAEYDPVTNTWSAIADMPQPSGNQAVVWWTDDIGDQSGLFRLGHWDGTAAKTSVRWIRETNTWSSIPDYPGVGTQAGNMATVVGDSIFLLHRTSLGEALFSRYSIREGTWEARTPPPAARWYGAACAYDGITYWFGGWMNEQSFYSYDPVAGDWATLPSPPSGVVGGNSPHMAGMQGRVVIQGGGNGWTPLAGCVSYDISSGSWTVEDPLPYTNYLGGAYGAVLYDGQWGIHISCGLPASGQRSNWHFRGRVPAPPVNDDVGIVEILIPAGTKVDPGEPVEPQGLLRNFGFLAQTDIPVQLDIYEGATLVYTSEVDVPGPLDPGDDINVDMASWIPGDALEYRMVMYSKLAGDERRSNDTAYKTVKTVEWEDIPGPATNEHRIVHSTVYDHHNDMFYMTGGNEAGQAGTYQTTHQRYDPAEEEWTDLAPMPTARGWLRGAYLDGRLHLIGGMDNFGRSNAHEIYDIAEGTWSTGPALPRLAGPALVAAWDGWTAGQRIYVMGGWSAGGDGVTTVDVYDPETETWASGTSLPMNADMGDAVVIDNRIYITVALYRSGSVVYNWPNIYIGEINPSNPTEINWTPGPAHTEPTSIGAATALDGKVYWLGGLMPTLATWSNKLWRYDPDADAIEELPFPYQHTIGRGAYLTARTAEGELYALAGDLHGDWAIPNNVYRKIRLGTPVFRDVGVTTLLEPSGTVYLGTPVYPRVLVRNFGEQDEPVVPVRVTITGPGEQVYDEVSYLSVDIGQEEELLFTEFWLPEDPGEIGDYEVVARTEMPGDQNPDNDEQIGAVTVADIPPFDPGWVEVAPMPNQPGNRRDVVRRGSWLAFNEGDGLIYATKGHRNQDFHAYDPVADTWYALAPAPLDPVRGRPLERGCRGVVDGDNTIYMVHGNNTQAFWKYDIAQDTWSALPEVPLGPSRRRVRGGGDMVHMVREDTGYVYLLKGDRTEFWRYNTESGNWEQLADAPMGMRPRWMRDSWLAFDGENAIYAHKARYFQRGAAHETHELWKYDVAGDSWVENVEHELAGMPLWGLHGGRLRRRRARDGGSAVYDNGIIYAIKGGNSQQFWTYNVAQDTWVESDTIPTWSPTTGRRRRLNAGSYLERYGPGVFFALKGNRTVEFWRYVVDHEPLARRPERSGVMAGHTARPVGISVTPSLVTGNSATLRYSLASPGPVNVNVYDVTGRSVLSTRTQTGTDRHGLVSLDMRSLSAGIYLVKVEAEGFTGTRKLVVQR